MFRIRINIDYNTQDRLYIKMNYTTCSSQQYILIKVNDLDLQCMWRTTLVVNATTLTIKQLHHLILTSLLQPRIT